VFDKGSTTKVAVDVPPTGRMWVHFLIFRLLLVQDWLGYVVEQLLIDAVSGWIRQGILLGLGD
jgi:hypothetical protein